MTRSIVCAASCVWSVAKTRWPVLGRGQRDGDGLEVAHLADQDDVGVLAQHVLERAGERPGVLPTSRWLTMHFWWRCRNSIGSSTVMMCSRRLRFARSISDASVVDLPEPVGPVTSTKPRVSLGEVATDGGTPSASSF
jgi:hypothetical protein